MSTPHRALLVIDAQNEYFTGALPIEYPPREQSIEHIARAMDAARGAAIPVAVVQHTSPPDSPAFVKGTPAWELHSEIARRPRDLLFEKTMPSAFTRTALDGWLAAHKIDTLVVTGYMTHNCVASTVLEAMHRGLAVEVLDDATGALAYENAAGRASAEEIQRAFQTVFQSNFAAVLSTAAWIERLATRQLPDRDNVIASNHRTRAGK